jgi:hypothetical protein
LVEAGSDLKVLGKSSWRKWAYIDQTMDGGNEERKNSAYNHCTRAWHHSFDYDRYGNCRINVPNNSDNADMANSALRCYSNIQGRLISVDPIIVTPERFLGPQQFNLYDIKKQKIERQNCVSNVPT